MSKSKIEWTDETWNPITGCTKVSAGCKNCYAETWAGRKMGEWANRDFSEVKFYPERLSIPAKRKKPTRFFVNSMSDLFHEKVSFVEIDKIMEVIVNNPQHTFQVLTKRAKTAYDYFNSAFRYSLSIPKNLWLGVSVENAKTAYERIPLLIQIPAGKRFLSCEPLLEKLPRLADIIGSHIIQGNQSYGIQWVIVGGESGRNARPMKSEWVRDIRDQCQDAGVKFFFKQWGEYFPFEQGTYDTTPVELYAVNTEIEDKDIPEFVPVGKKKAGRLLDGKEYNEMPEVSHGL